MLTSIEKTKPHVVARTMRAARLHEVGKPMAVEDIPIPAVRPNDVRVKVKACNIVPNLNNILANWKVWNPNLPLPELPAVFGLDASGVVDEVGEQVVGFKRGDRVYVNPGVGCGSCKQCMAGEMYACPNYVFVGYFGFGPDAQKLFDAYPIGGLAEYLLAPQFNLVRLHDTISHEQAARFGYLGTAFAGVLRSECGPGDTLVIDGATGTLGLGAVISALALNVGHILGTARNVSLLNRVKALAPDRIDVWSTEDGPAGGWIRERTGGRGPDAAINCLGPGSPAANVVETLGTLRRGGRFVNIGGTAGDVPLDIFGMMAAHQSLICNNWFTTVQAQQMADLAGLGKLDLSVFEHERYSLENVNAALAGITSRNGGFTNLLVIP